MAYLYVGHQAPRVVFVTFIAFLSLVNTHSVACQSTSIYHVICVKIIQQ